MTVSTSKTVRERVGKLIEWHRQQAADLSNLSGSVRARAHRARFHEDAAKCLDALTVAIKDDALAYIDAADELYSATKDARKKFDKRQRAALDAFAKASNQWAQHPRKCST